MSRATVSVVVPVRDDAVALEALLTRLAHQTRLPDEVVVVDNGSTDASASVARAHGARVVDEPRVGIPRAAATGYDAASGELVVRCDADTVPGRRWLERLVAPLEADDRLDAVTGVGTFHDAPRGLRTLLAVLYLGAYYVSSHLALGHTVLWGSNMAVRRTSWKAAADAVHRDADVHDDMDLAFVLGPGSRIRLVPVVVGVSARSLRGGSHLRRRLGRARRTLELNWRTSPPWLRWRDRYQVTWGQISSWVSRKPAR
jgi:glycosyltransferase involved in cell wall biosynthesis